jgi:Tol biopolymer transport system component
LIEQIGSPAPFRGIDVSPDGKRVAFHRHDNNSAGDVSVLDQERNTTSRLTFDPSQENSGPIWSPDGNRVAFSSTRGGKVGIYIKAADGTGEDTKPRSEPEHEQSTEHAER